MSRSRWNSRRTLRGAALAGLTVLALGACTDQDADREDVVDAVEEAGASRDVANCVGDGFEDAFDQDQLNDLANADSPEDFPDSISDEANEIMQTCWDTDGESSGAPSESTDSTENTESTESTTTTAAAE